MPYVFLSITIYSWISSRFFVLTPFLRNLRYFGNFKQSRVVAFPKCLANLLLLQKSFYLFCFLFSAITYSWYAITYFRFTTRDDNGLVNKKSGFNTKLTVYDQLNNERQLTYHIKKNKKAYNTIRTWKLTTVNGSLSYHMFEYLIMCRLIASGTFFTFLLDRVTETVSSDYPWHFEIE